MAIIACSECGGTVSDKAATCPHCGNPMAPPVEAKVTDDTTPEALMKKYGVSYDGNRYVFREHHYDKFDDALEFAKVRYLSNEPESVTGTAALVQSKPASKWWLVIVIPLLLFALLFVFGLMSKNDPAFQAKSSARRAIELCWDEQKRKSLDPGSQRFIAGACEKMERDFVQQYGVNP